MLKPILVSLGLAAIAAPALAQPDPRPPMRVGVQSVLPSLDPGMALGNAGFAVTFNIFDTLIVRNFGGANDGTGGELVPGLAASWRRVDDRTIELVLREGVKFQNGDPLTSDDVKFTFERILKSDSPYQTARTQLGNIAAVDAPNARTVRISTRQPDALLTALLAYPGSAIVPKKYYNEVGFAAFGQKPIGTGPYRVEGVIADREIRLRSHDDYWNGKPSAATLSFKVIPEVSARITALANREIDVAASLPPDQLAAVESLGTAVVRKVPVNSRLLNFNTSDPVMRNKAFRQALGLAIDRNTLSRAFWNGEAEVLNGHQYKEWGELYEARRAAPRYDAAKAKELVRASGYAGQQLTFRTHPAYYTNGLSEAQAIVQMWQKVGVNARVQVDENWARVPRTDPNLQVRNLSDWMIVADPAATIHWSWTITALWDGEAAGEFDRLGKEARASLNSRARHQIYQKMLDLFDEEAPGVVLYRTNEYYGVDKNVRWQPYTLYIMDFRKGALSFK